MATFLPSAGGLRGFGAMMVGDRKRELEDETGQRQDARLALALQQLVLGQRNTDKSHALDVLQTRHAQKVDRGNLSLARRRSEQTDEQMKRSRYLDAVGIAAQKKQFKDSDRDRATGEKWRKLDFLRTREGDVRAEEAHKDTLKTSASARILSERREGRAASAEERAAEEHDWRRKLFPAQETKARLETEALKREAKEAKQDFDAEGAVRGFTAAAQQGPRALDNEVKTALASAAKLPASKRAAAVGEIQTYAGAMRGAAEAVAVDNIDAVLAAPTMASNHLRTIKQWADELPATHEARQTALGRAFAKAVQQSQPHGARIMARGAGLGREFTVWETALRDADRQTRYIESKIATEEGKGRTALLRLVPRLMKDGGMTEDQALVTLGLKDPEQDGGMDAGGMLRGLLGRLMQQGMNVGNQAADAFGARAAAYENKMFPGGQ